MIFDATRYDVTIVVARGERAEQLRAWFDGLSPDGRAD